MSKADRLGAGASFGQTQTISARRAAINANTSAPTEGAPPPVKLSVDLISLNPDNPRSELGDLTDLGASLRDHGQKTAISIMGRFAYLEGNPGREHDLEPETKYVVIDGNSRLAASREAGLTEIKVMLDDDLGSNPDEILESALVANIHRQDLDHLDEAKALDQLLKVHGTQEALATRLHRSQGWVSQRLALLTLTPELKQKLQSGEESAALLRRVGKKNAEEQEEHLRLLKEREAQEAADKKARAKQRVASSRKQPPPTPPVENSPSEEPSGPAANPVPSPDHYAVINGAASDETAGSDLPKPREEAGTASQLPSRDPEALSELIIAELDVPTRRKLTELLVDYKIEETKRMRAQQASAAAEK
ncbi:ParB/RepB/Spo0J family partition protein [Streptomyces sp. ok210]|jgi:ParB family chromosome partitioning protein|uniref:ParB/RepB/Spo0J family partition protein n=1 Tax=Streptomyces sp. ok210 TaxID=1761905 RepID=UPI0008EA98DD|nr:ParB/RepB/Spo0J family partition protein [Streptomyces sp. ok210]SFT21594.1 chromosome partitioning protein, ParB family [Streptomyces sp. ok210]